MVNSGSKNLQELLLFSRGNNRESPRLAVLGRRGKNSGIKKLFHNASLDRIASERANASSCTNGLEDVHRPSFI